MLIAQGSIVIPKPVEEVWRVITAPSVPQTWIDEWGGFLISDWQVGDSIVWKDKTGADYFRGTVKERAENKYIYFNLLDAYEEDNHDPDYGEDWNIEQWKIFFEPEDGNTRVTLEIGDYDSEHDTDDEHDHEQTMQTYLDVVENSLPQKLQKMSEFFN